MSCLNVHKLPAHTKDDAYKVLIFMVILLEWESHFQNDSFQLMIDEANHNASDFKKPETT